MCYLKRYQNYNIEGFVLYDLFVFIKDVQNTHMLQTIRQEA